MRYDCAMMSVGGRRSIATPERTSGRNCIQENSIVTKTGTGFGNR